MDHQFENRGGLLQLIEEIRYYLGHDVSSNIIPCYFSRHDRERRLTYPTQYRSFIGLLPPYLDSTLSVTATQSANNLEQAVLMKGVKSISISAGKKISAQTNKVKTLFSKNPDKSEAINKQLYQYLSNANLEFFSSIFGVVHDFTLYGNGVLYLHINDGEEEVLKWLPFWQICFEFDELGKLQWVRHHFEENNTNRRIKMHLYVQNGIWVREKKIEEKGEVTLEETYRYPKGIQAAFVVREGRYGDTQYGYGAAFQTLNYTKQLNWIADHIMYATEKSVDSAHLFDANMRFATLGLGQDKFDASPRAMIAYSMRGENTGQPPVIPLQPTGVDIQYLSALSITVRENLQSMFFVDPVLTSNAAGSGVARTATEVRERKASSLSLYRGKSLLLENDILTPLVYTILNILKIKPGKDEEFRVEYFTIENQLSKEEKIYDLTTELQLLAQAPDEESQQEIKQIFEEN